MGLAWQAFSSALYTEIEASGECQSMLGLRSKAERSERVSTSSLSLGSNYLQVDADKGQLSSISSQSKKAKLLHPITVVATGAPGTLILGCSSGDVCLMQCPAASGGAFTLLGKPPIASPGLQPSSGL